MMRKLLACLLCLSVLLPPALADLPDLGDPAQADLTPAQEHRIGESVMRDLRNRDPSFLDDPEVENYLEDLGNKLVASAQAGGQDFQFFALRDPTLNAFALPGGFIGVHSGLILAARTESELAGVLAHEVSHVTQRHIARIVSQQSSTGPLLLASLLVAILAARNSPEAAQAAIATTQAAAIQSQLSYQRDFEREADRIGFQTLAAAGFDERGMADFFQRLQRNSRTYENNAPAYLRTHPLTVERIADMENRVREQSYRQIPDSLEFRLVQARLAAEQGSPDEALARTAKGQSGGGLAAAAHWYERTRALLRARNGAGAAQALARLRETGQRSPMVESLAADVARSRGQPQEAARICREARASYPNVRFLGYCEADALLAADQAREAAALVERLLTGWSADARLYTLASRSYERTGQQTLRHRAQAEAYLLRGSLRGAIDQLEVAQRAADADFYTLSAVDARLRELKARYAEERNDKSR